MGFIREPLNVDFTFIDRQPTEEESRMMSEYIRKYKAEHAKGLEKSAEKGKRMASTSSKNTLRKAKA
jgi:hypothetical protein